MRQGDPTDIFMFHDETRGMRHGFHVEYKSLQLLSPHNFQSRKDFSSKAKSKCRSPITVILFSIPWSMEDSTTFSATQCGQPQRTDLYHDPTR
jgi:hypothetical protein